jgi:tetraacyldisaccharide 4'-kinase
MREWLLRRWYAADRPAPAGLTGAAAIYGRVSAWRRRRQSQRAARNALPIPVIVVGNISVGGTGKTPFVIWLVEQLQQWGYRPGVISRGYGGRAPEYPMRVHASSSPEHAGDEPALMAQRLSCPIAVAPDRMAAARMLIDDGEIDLLIADDGLQHYKLPRDLEICVVDGRRGLGNGALLPAGPLREPPARLREVDLVIVSGEGWHPPQGDCLRMRLEPGELRPVAGIGRAQLSDFAGRRVHAVAGIGDPERFFASLREARIEVIAHPFADHYHYTALDLAFGDDLPVLMTEKDAVKCVALAQPDWWVVPVTARLPVAAGERVRELISSLD